MVEREEITGHLNASTRALHNTSIHHNSSISPGGGDSLAHHPLAPSAHHNNMQAPARSFTGHKLYTEYLRREGRPAPPPTAGSERSSVLSSPRQEGSVRGEGGGRPASSGFYRGGGDGEAWGGRSG